MISQKGSSVLKSCVRRSFLLRVVIYKPSQPIHIILATHGLRNAALCVVTGCLCPTPTDHLPIPSDVQPVELCQLEVTLSLAYHGFLDPDYILYGLLSWPLDAFQERLRSRCLFVPAAQNFLSNHAGLGIHTSKRSVCV